MARLPCDELHGTSELINCQVACDILGISTRALWRLCGSGDLDPPQYQKYRTLYNRAQVMRLHELYGYKPEPGDRTRIIQFQKMNFHLRHIDLGIPSTWWEQARSIANERAIHDRRTTPRITRSPAPRAH